MDMAPPDSLPSGDRPDAIDPAAAQPTSWDAERLGMSCLGFAFDTAQWIPCDKD